MSDADDPLRFWRDAELAGQLLAIDPPGLGGAWVRAPAGMVRDRWLQDVVAGLEGATPVRRLPLNTHDNRLLGGLDLAATLSTKRPVLQRGLLSEANDGIVIAAMAERLEPTAVARLAAALDRGAIDLAREGLVATLEARFALVALDEGEGEEERLPPALADRLAFHVTLRTIPPRLVADATPAPVADLADARQRLAETHQTPEAEQAITALALALGVDSLRAPIFALRAARAHAALLGRTMVEQEDLEAAARLVLAQRATRLPAPPDETEPPPPEPEQQEPPDEAPDDPHPLEERDLSEMLVETVAGALPPDLLQMLSAEQPPRRGAAAPGPAGANRKSLQRGRQIGTRPGDLSRGRLDLVATLRAAAPWQPLRASASAAGIRVHRDDFRLKRLRHRAGSLAVFAVDASGSAALQRLGEAKGAVERLLADCYVRREEVALIAFRGTSAERLLPPTRSLTRAKRSLAGLPGGGGTPLAAGIRSALEDADGASRRGRTPVLVLLTDGRANIGLDGQAGRTQAMRDALAMADAVALAGVKAVLVDLSPRPNAQARELAERMRARYLPLPYADPERIARVVRDQPSP